MITVAKAHCHKCSSVYADHFVKYTYHMDIELLLRYEDTCNLLCNFTHLCVSIPFSTCDNILLHYSISLLII